MILGLKFHRFRLKISPILLANFYSISQHLCYNWLTKHKHEKNFTFTYFPNAAQ